MPNTAAPAANVAGIPAAGKSDFATAPSSRTLLSHASLPQAWDPSRLFCAVSRPLHPVSRILPCPRALPEVLTLSLELLPSSPPPPPSAPEPLRHPSLLLRRFLLPSRLSTRSSMVLSPSTSLSVKSSAVSLRSRCVSPLRQSTLSSLISAGIITGSANPQRIHRPKGLRPTRRCLQETLIARLLRDYHQADPASAHGRA